MAPVPESANEGTRLRNTELTAIPESESSHQESSTASDDKELPHVAVKDNRKAWTVCMAAFFSQVIVMGNVHVFGIYYVSFLDEFKETKAKTGDCDDTFAGKAKANRQFQPRPVSSSSIEAV